MGRKLNVPSYHINIQLRHSRSHVSPKLPTSQMTLSRTRKIQQSTLEHVAQAVEKTAGPGIIWQKLGVKDLGEVETINLSSNTFTIIYEWTKLPHLR